MLEGAFYGLDLLKLHSVTSKLVGRVDKLEEVRKVLDFCIFLSIKPQSVSKLTIAFFFFFGKHIPWLYLTHCSFERKKYT